MKESAIAIAKASATKLKAVSWAVPVGAAFYMPVVAYAQGPARPGLSASKPLPSTDSIKTIADAISAVIAYPIYAFLEFCRYTIDHPAIATLLTASIAAYIAISSINTTRSIARLRETFTAYSKDNWDEDVIKAKYLFSSVKRKCLANPQVIASYFEQLPDKDFSEIEDQEKRQSKIAEYAVERKQHEELVVTLRTIMNDHENKALGIRTGILDEGYAYRYLRGGVLIDWQFLSPLVASYRFRLKNDQLFIEFEGLVNAWSQSRSFRTGKKLRLSKKRTVFR